MTTFLQRTGTDLAFASVIAPLASYGLHQMIPAPDVRFIAAASTLNIYAVICLRDWAQGMIYKLAGKLIQNPENLTLHKSAYNNAISAVTQRLNVIFILTLSTLLPIFWRFMGQKMGIPVPNYIPMLGYICFATNVNAVVNSSINVLSTYGNYKAATK